MLSIGPYKAPLVSWAHYATLLAAGPVLARAWSTSPKPDTATEQIHRSPGLPLGRPAMLPSWGLKSTALPQSGEGDQIASSRRGERDQVTRDRRSAGTP